MWGMWKRATVVSVVLTLLGSAPVAEAAFPGQNGKIAFDAGGQVRTVNADGSGSAVVGPGVDPAWSPDGTRLLFYDGVYFRVTTADGSTVRTILTGFGRDPIWSPDGTRIAFVRDRPWDDQSYPDEIVVMNADGSGETQITAGGCPGDPFNFPPCDEIQSLSWEPNGNRIAFTRAEWFVDPASEMRGRVSSPSPARLVRRSGHHPGTETMMPASPDRLGRRLGAERAAVAALRHERAPRVAERDGARHGEAVRLGRRVVAGRHQDRLLNIEDGRRDPRVRIRRHAGTAGRDRHLASDAAWQPLQPPKQPTYVRPAGAAPFEARLVIAYRQCQDSNQNRSHGPPLALRVLRATGADIGVPDRRDRGLERRPNGGAGQDQVRRVAGNPATPADEADVVATVSISDVRVAGSLADYAGELGVQFPLRIVDRANTGPGPGVVVDTTFGFAVPCAPTTDTTIGSACAVSTTFDAVVPGAIAEARRAIWQLGQLQVMDGGLDGDVDTAVNTLFMTQGVFVPSAPSAGRAPT